MDNRSFWNERYVTAPELGSGPGSRGYSAWIKQYVMETVTRLNNIDSVIDVGCGDLCWMKDGLFQNQHYVGVDISDIIIERNIKRYPQHTFVLHDFVKSPIEMKADLVVSFDVLIHQCEIDKFINMLTHIIDSTNRYALISYLTPGESFSVTTAIPKFVQENAPASIIQEELKFQKMFESIPAHIPRAKTVIYGDLPTLIHGLFKNVAVRPVLTYREHTIYEITKDTCWLRWDGSREPSMTDSTENAQLQQIASVPQHQQAGTSPQRSVHDIPEDLLQPLRRQSSNPSLLDELVELSRQTIGFFTRHTARAFEYVWLVEQTNNLLGKQVLDVGAGVSPLPFYLARQGAFVCTVDLSSEVRDPSEDRTHWNEWGFLDYGRLHPDIHSLNMDINDASFEASRFDYIYSISSIEHAPASSRQKMWEKFRTWIKPDGKLLLTVDLYKGENDLWNLCDGQVVEDRQTHGNLEDFIREAEEYFVCESLIVNRDIYQLERVDVAAMVFAPKA
jgi:2-polyprenyl-3-methyl-5-hydroxy-6-metoxy-1,4-benzoquinol methylase